MTQDNYENQNVSEEYSSINSRLKEIKEQIGGENLSLDDSLKLYEEAVALGMKATKAVEQNVYANLHDQDEEDSVEDSSSSQADSDELSSDEN